MCWMPVLTPYPCAKTVMNCMATTAPNKNRLHIKGVTISFFVVEYSEKQIANK